MTEPSSGTPAAAAGDRGADVPIDVTMDELNELVRLFNQSDWDGLEVDLRGIYLVLGRRDTPTVAGAAGEAVTPSVPAPATAASAPPPAANAAESPSTPDPAAAAEPAPATPPPAAAPPEPGDGRRTEVTAPVVGTFWVAPSPGEQPFVQLGDEIEAGQQLAIVEVMKLMSEVSSPVAGRVVEVRADNAELVEFEQVLFVIESDDG